MEKVELSSRHEPEPVPTTSFSQFLATEAARILSIGTFIILFIWVFQYLGGLSWNRGYEKQNFLFFNLHPFFMILGVCFFLTNGILSWRDVGRVAAHIPTKLIHFTLNALGLGCIAIGLFVTIQFNKGPHIVSLHSWVALAAAGLLGIQALGGILMYLFPIFPFHVRAGALPTHSWLGVISYIMLNMVAISGLVQFEWFKSGFDRGQMRSNTTILANVLGLFIFVSTLCAAWSVMPRRNIITDIEERDGVRMDDAARTSLKGRPYATTGGTYSTSTPYTTEPIPTRRGVPVERETF